MGFSEVLAFVYLVYYLAEGNVLKSIERNAGWKLIQTSTVQPLGILCSALRHMMLIQERTSSIRQDRTLSKQFDPTLHVQATSESPPCYESHASKTALHPVYLSSLES